MWPFRRKDAAPIEKKAASFLVGPSAARFMNHRYEAFAGEGYSLNGVVNACVTKLAGAVSSVDLMVYRKGDDGKLVKMESHPLIDLLNRPNPLMSGKRLVQHLASYYLIGGNAYLLGVGIDPFRNKAAPPTELYLLKPDHVAVLPGDGLFPQRYESQERARRAIYPVNQLDGRSAVLHVKTFNPLDEWVGLSPMVAAAYGVDIFNAGQRWNKSLLDNDARPSGALKVTDGEGKAVTLTDEQHLRLKEQIDGQYSGISNAGRPLLLEGGLEWVPMSLSAKDMDHRESMLTNARFIAGVYHVPPQLVNIPGESTFANYQQAEISFWANTVLPLLGMFLDDLNRWLTPLYGDDLFIWYSEDDIPALEPRRKEKAERINTAGYMTIDEKREAMGLPALPDGMGQIVLVQSSTVPLELAGAMPLAEPGSPEEQDDER